MLLQVIVCIFAIELIPRHVNTQEVTEEQSDVTILRQINRLNDDGSYTFGYEASDGSFKIETRDVEGNVKGMFGFVDENGELKRISYSAKNGTGFQASGTIATPVEENVRLNPSYTTVKPPTTNHHQPFLRRPILILKAMTPEEEEEESEREEAQEPTPRRPYYPNEASRRAKEYGEYYRGNKPVPSVDSNELTSGRPVLARKVFVGKRPSEDINEKRPRGGSGLRRQLHRGGDTSDVRGAGSGTFIGGQAPAIPSKLAVLASLMNEFEASSRSYPGEYSTQESQYGKVSYSEPDYVDYADLPTRAPVTKQYYPITTPIPTPTPGYPNRPINPDIPYRNPIYPQREPYSLAYNALREELMEYILQFLQQRLFQGQYGPPLGVNQDYNINQNIPPPIAPLPYPYQTPYNPLRSFVPSPLYPQQSFLSGRYPISPLPYLSGRNYPQQPIPLATPNIQYSEPVVKYPSMEDLTTQNPKLFSSRRVTPRRKFRPSPQVDEPSYEYTTQSPESGQHLLTSPTSRTPVRYVQSSTSTTEASRQKSSQPVRNVQIIESESRVSPVTTKSSKPVSESSSVSS